MPKKLTPEQETIARAEAEKRKASEREIIMNMTPAERNRRLRNLRNMEG